MDRFSYILFDLDGTLSASGEGITRSLAIALDSFGIHETSKEVLESFIGPPLNTQLKDVYGVSDDEALAIIQTFRKRYETIGYKECHLYPDVPDMLHALAKENGCLAVASSKPEPFVLKILDLFSLRPFFTVICGSGMEEETDGTASSGQKSRIIKKTLALLAKEKGTSVNDIAASALMVGDRFYDIDSAKDNRIASAGVTWGYGAKDELAGADFVADTAAELISYITGKK